MRNKNTWENSKEKSPQLKRNIIWTKPPWLLGSILIIRCVVRIDVMKAGNNCFVKPTGRLGQVLHCGIQAGGKGFARSNDRIVSRVPLHWCFGGFLFCRFNGSAGGRQPANVCMLPWVARGTLSAPLFFRGLQVNKTNRVRAWTWPKIQHFQVFGPRSNALTSNSLKGVHLPTWPRSEFWCVIRVSWRFTHMSMQKPPVCRGLMIPPSWRTARSWVFVSIAPVSTRGPMLKNTPLTKTNMTFGKSLFSIGNTSSFNGGCSSQSC